MRSYVPHAYKIANVVVVGGAFLLELALEGQTHREIWLTGVLGQARVYS